MACGPPPVCCLTSPAMPGSPRCCWPSWGLAAPSVSPQLQLFLQFLALAGSTSFMYTTCSKALMTPHRGCPAALSSLSLFVLPKPLPWLPVLFSLPPAPCLEVLSGGRDLVAEEAHNMLGASEERPDTCKDCGMQCKMVGV